jgi:hypothetical protein
MQTSRAVIWQCFEREFSLEEKMEPEMSIQLVFKISKTKDEGSMRL